MLPVEVSAYGTVVCNPSGTILAHQEDVIFPSPQLNIHEASLSVT
jgi:hypothetical protein